MKKLVCLLLFTVLLVCTACFETSSTNNSVLDVEPQINLSTPTPTPELAASPHKKSFDSIDELISYAKTKANWSQYEFIPALKNIENKFVIHEILANETYVWISYVDINNENINFPVSLQIGMMTTTDYNGYLGWAKNVIGGTETTINGKPMVVRENDFIFSENKMTETYYLFNEDKIEMSIRVPQWATSLGAPEYFTDLEHISFVDNDKSVTEENSPEPSDVTDNSLTPTAAPTPTITPTPTIASTPVITPTPTVAPTPTITPTPIPTSIQSENAPPTPTPELAASPHKKSFDSIDELISYAKTKANWSQYEFIPMLKNIENKFVIHEILANETYVWISYVDINNENINFPVSLQIGMMTTTDYNGYLGWAKNVIGGTETTINGKPMVVRENDFIFSENKMTETYYLFNEDKIEMSIRVPQWATSLGTPEYFTDLAHLSFE